MLWAVLLAVAVGCCRWLLLLTVAVGCWMLGAGCWLLLLLLFAAAFVVCCCCCCCLLLFAVAVAVGCCGRKEGGRTKDKTNSHARFRDKLAAKQVAEREKKTVT